MKTFVILISAFLVFNLTSCATHVKARPAATKVTIIKTPPRHYKIVKVRGKRYYFWNGNHYRKTRKGYVITRV
ncbi:hypothetical protein [Seonamhaeicola marinus]|uniref:Uncharacterized protein n=1 Tax=Seonamhaeicola marinus TaxID=1912246 RepID=A0A5D0HVB0_9FLAO|nr:hypothetical protein [Seonamhaeicola marinus]TYA74087.1 hypothetical protein FUA24_12125 [Seonamhaeicola marinus]